MESTNQVTDTIDDSTTIYINGNGIPPNIYSYLGSFDIKLYWIRTQNIRTDARRGAFTVADTNVFIRLVKDRLLHILGDKDGFKTDLNQLHEARIGAQKWYDDNVKETNKLATNHSDITALFSNERYFIGPNLTNATRRKNYNARLAKYDVNQMIEKWVGNEIVDNILKTNTSPRSTTSTTTFANNNGNISTSQMNVDNTQNTNVLTITADDNETDDEIILLNNKTDTPPGTPNFSNMNDKQSKSEMDIDNDNNQSNEDMKNENEGAHNIQWEKSVNNISDFIPYNEVNKVTPGGPQLLNSINNTNKNNTSNFKSGELSPVMHFKSNKFVKSNIDSIIEYEMKFEKWKKEINEYLNEMFNNIKQDKNDPTLSFNDVRKHFGSYIHRMTQMLIAYRVYFHLTPKPDSFKVLLGMVDDNKLKSTIFDYYHRQFLELIKKEFIGKNVGERLKSFDKLLIAPKDAYKVHHGKVIKSVQFQNMIHPIKPNPPSRKRKKPLNGWDEFQIHHAKRIKTKHSNVHKQMSYDKNNKLQNELNKRKAELLHEQISKQQEIEKMKNDKKLYDLKSQINDLEKFKDQQDIKLKSLQDELYKKLEQIENSQSTNNNKNNNIFGSDNKVVNDLKNVLKNYDNKLKNYDNKLQPPESPLKPYLSKQNEKKRGAEINSPEFKTVYKTLEGFKVIDKKLYESKQHENGHDLYQSLLNKQNISNKSIVKELQGLWVRSYNLYQCESVHKTLVYAVRYDSG